MDSTLKLIEAGTLPAATANGHHTPDPIAEAQQLTEEDLARFFTAQVQRALLEGDPDGDIPPPPPMVSIGDEFYRWAGTHYAPLRRADLQKTVTDIARVTVLESKDGKELHPFMKPRFISEAITWLQMLTARDPGDLNPSGLINCRNGVLRIVWNQGKPTPVLEAHDPSLHLFTDEPALIYDPNADTTHAQTLLQCLDDPGRQLFLEVGGASLDVDAVRSRGHRIPALLFIGTGQNGKDTLGDCIARLHGRSSVATNSIKDWQQYESGSGRGRFSIAQLASARISLCSENSGAFKLDNLESLKIAITGDRLYIEQKNKGGFNIHPRAIFLFFLNAPPLLDGGSAAILSRWGVAKMPHSYSTDPRPGQLKADPRFKHDPEFLATEVLPGLLNLMIQALEQVVTNGFSLKQCAAALQELRHETSHLHDFLRDCSFEVGGPTDYVEAKDVWAELQRWYRAENWMKLNAAGDWVHIPTDDGDKPVLAPRLLPKRLKLLHPEIKVVRSTDGRRRTLLYGLRQREANATNIDELDF